MAPKRILRKKREFCEHVEGDRFYAPPHDVFRFNWWEVCCFPYILGARVWDCCVTMCSGTNQCMVYWMLIQWIVCKINRMTTPDPIVFPYFFYMFSQVFILLIAFILLMYFFGPTIIFPYFVGFYNHFVGVEQLDGGSTVSVTVGEQGPLTTIEAPNQTDNGTLAPVNFRVAFRRYCFRRGEIFDVPLEANYCSRLQCSYPVCFLSMFTTILMHEYL